MAGILDGIKVNAQILALSAVAAGETFHLGSACMPSYFTAKNWVLDGEPKQVAERIAAYRSGYRPAVLVGVGLSIALSILAESPLPTVFSFGAAVAMLTMYEGALPKDMRLSLADWPGFLLTGQTPTALALTTATTPALPAGDKQTGL